jgi:hypothetical protein
MKNPKRFYDNAMVSQVSLEGLNYWGSLQEQLEFFCGFNYTTFLDPGTNIW